MTIRDQITSRLAPARERLRLPRIPRRGIWPYLLALGPGLLAASAGNDAGGIATYASAGADYGYELLWAMVIVTVFVGIVQEMSARLGAITGKGFSDLVRENFSLRTTALILLTLFVANFGIIVSEFVGEQNGIGYYLIIKQSEFDYPSLYAGILFLGLLGYVLNLLFLLVERRVLAWHYRAAGE